MINADLQEVLQFAYMANKANSYLMFKDCSLCYAGELVRVEQKHIVICSPYFLPGIPCPIIIAWAVGKLYNENEQ